MALQSIETAEIEGKKVLVRLDFNVPLDKEGRSKILDTSRIDLALPTIKYILEKNPKKLVLMSHLGRPKGKKSPDFSLEPVANYLAEKLNEEVILTEGPIDAGVKELLTLPSTKIILLENLRFLPEETSNSMNYARRIAEYGDIYVNDAFGVSHRSHASVHAIIKFFKKKAYAGFLIQKEIESLDKVLNSPDKPFVSVVGGAKVSDKIKTIEKLLIASDHLIIGGAMAYPFLKAKGYTVGKSLCSDEDVELAQSIIRADKGNKLVLPVDHIVSTEFGGSPEGCATANIEDDKMGLDIGPDSIVKYQRILADAKTILWNGPMGAFENADYAKGTMSLCETIANADAFTVVGGGDSVSAVKQSGLSEKFSHVSTGGGASLEYIEKGELPGIQALKFGV